MNLLTKRILLFGLLLLLNACVYHPRHFYDRGYGHSGHYRSYDNHDGNHHRGSHNHHGDKYHGRRHH